MFFLVPSVSNFLKTSFVDSMPVTGFLNNIKTIIILKICSVFPDMYIIIAFIGKAFAGARAISQDFFTFRRSVSAVVGGLRLGVLEVVARLKIRYQHTCSIPDVRRVTYPAGAGF